MGQLADVGDETISVLVADDSVIIREGVRAMLAAEADLTVVGSAEDYDTLVAGAESHEPQVIVSDIRMPPNFQREGIDACKEIRKRHPGTGVVILSQYDDPDYAISLLSEGAAGYAYLLKDRIAEGDQLARAIREVATGGSMLDPAIVGALVRPVQVAGGLSAEDEALLTMVAAGKPIKAIAAVRHTTPSAVADEVERLFVTLAKAVSDGRRPGLAPPPAPARGHRRAGGAGRDPEPPAAGRRGRAPVQGRLGHRRDGAARGHGADVRHPRLLDHRRAHRPRGVGPPARTGTGPR